MTVQDYVGIQSAWQTICKQLHPELLQQLEFAIGPELIEDSLDHFNEASALADILNQKVGEVNKILFRTEQIPPFQFQESLIQQYTKDLLKQQNLEKFLQQKQKVERFLQTETVCSFKQKQNSKKEPLAAKPLNVELNQEFIQRIKNILKTEHTELDIRIREMNEQIYSNHKIERIAKQLYLGYQQAEQAVDLESLKSFSQSMANMVFAPKDDDLLLEQLQDPVVNITDKLSASMRPGSARQLKPLETRPATAVLTQTIKAPPKMLQSIRK